MMWFAALCAFAVATPAECNFTPKSQTGEDCLLEIDALPVECYAHGIEQCALLPPKPPPSAKQKSCSVDGNIISCSNNGNSYVGEFQDNKMHGKGTWTRANGDKYVGLFQADKIHGTGVYSYANGYQYSGSFELGMRQGEGVLTYPNGEEAFRGQWLADKPYDGKGLFVDKDDRFSYHLKQGVRQKNSSGWGCASVQGAESSLLAWFGALSFFGWVRRRESEAYHQ